MAEEQKETGLTKAAMLMVALGPEVASEVFKHLSDNETERLTLEIAGINKLAPDEKGFYAEGAKEVEEEMAKLK